MAKTIKQIEKYLQDEIKEFREGETNFLNFAAQNPLGSASYTQTALVYRGQAEALEEVKAFISGE